MAEYIKGKIAWFPAHELKRLSPETPMDFSDIGEWYDVLEETLLNQGFVLPDDDIEFKEQYVEKGFHVFRYNCAVVKTTKRNEQYILHEIGIQYLGIKKSRITDLDKLANVLNVLKMPVDGNGNPTPEGQEAYKNLKTYIEKMRELGVSNLKQLLK